MKNKNYDHKKIETKWQKYWESKKMYRADDKSKSKKFFPLVEFPFPSGQGLHTGHIRSYTAMDVVARKHRMMGENVLYPIGWDAFGLPTENYAIKTGIQPAIVTKKNTDNFRKQLKLLGMSFDWTREVNTTDPAYYKWTQWIFLQMYKNGLAYKNKMTVNWCPKDKIVLANEEVVNGRCDRCEGPVEKKDKEQWMLAITKYADRLDKDLDEVDFLEKIKIQQRNWIGKSEGSELDFKIKFNSDDFGKISVFTTRADTLHGVTYVVLAPEHNMVKDLINKISNKNEVEKYISESKKKEDIERTAEGKEKTGVELRGVTAINPANGEEVPVWIADYVLASYGTGAVMAVPAHDDRDFAFAKKYNLPIKEVIIPVLIDKVGPHVKGKKTVVRKTVHALIEDPKTGKFLGLKWKNHPWTTFILGGVENDEDIVEAARREIFEETGYKNLKLVKILNESPVRAEYFAAHKDENRVSYAHGIYFKLENDERENITADEESKHEVVWLDMDYIKSGKMTCSELEIWLAKLNEIKTGKDEYFYVGDGELINSGKFSGFSSEQARKEITKSAGGKSVTKFKLRDWIFSRQRYWGEPIPMIKCDKCGWVPVPEKDLPVTLPKIKKYEPTDNGESPLASVPLWYKVKCPKCKSPAVRETDTMPNWAGSSWYYLRYVDAKNKKVFANKSLLKKWTPVDWYNGGMEHTTLHLLYSRFWHKFLFDIGAVPTKEPYMKRTSHGMILAEGGEKMSKSRGNVVNPDDMVKLHGADTLRVYEMFMGPFDQSIIWNTDNMVGSRRFIERVYRLIEKVDLKKKTAPKGEDRADLEILLNQTKRKVSDDIESMGFNTCISSLMILLNSFEKQNVIYKTEYEDFLKILAPFAPHVTDELWTMIGNKKSIHLEKWPEFDVKKLTSQRINIIVQVNGKFRASFHTEFADQETVEKDAKNLPEIIKWIEGKEIKKVIYVPSKLLNIVVA